jgi:hypothetical protein
MFHFYRQVCQKHRGLKQHLRKNRILPRTLAHAGIPKRRVEKFNHSVVVEFYCRDDNSRTTAGKKETRTRGGQKSQIRYMHYNVETLFFKFVAEYGDVMSRSLFFSLRPFYVLCPSLKNRDTCMCMCCANCQLILDAGFGQGLVATKDREVEVRKIVCSDSSPSCMYRECGKCLHIIAHNPAKLTAQLSVTYYNWGNVLNSQGFSTLECNAVCHVKHSILSKTLSYKFPLFVCFLESRELH